MGDIFILYYTGDFSMIGNVPPFVNKMVEFSLLKLSCLFGKIRYTQTDRRACILTWRHAQRFIVNDNVTWAFQSHRKADFLPCGAIFRSKPKRGKTVALAAACLLRRINGWPGEILRFHEENVVPVRIRTDLNSFVSMQHPKWVQ